jgi:sigma-E factor negative regulatory protein RseB
MVFSDGLASVSVFVEPAEATDKKLSGLSRMGAAHAFTVISGDQQVTAVGEVPPATVERIARSLRAVEAATP